MKLTREEALNNPGGIVHSHIAWNGMAPDQSDEKFVKFLTPADGLHALVMNLLAYGREGVKTIANAIIKWAPAKENNVAAYIADVCTYCRCLPTDPLKPRDPNQVKAIIHHENGRVIYTDAQVATAIDSTYQKATPVNLHPDAQELPQAPKPRTWAEDIQQATGRAGAESVPLPQLPAIPLPASLDRQTLWNWFLANGDKLFATLCGLALYLYQTGAFPPAWGKTLTIIFGAAAWIHLHYLPAPLPVFKNGAQQ
ncbi:MAG TPA: hypothetical protein VGG49_13315 [Steroidobacteraceae bacterium]|jgi:hypothetical protein